MNPYVLKHRNNYFKLTKKVDWIIKKYNPCRFNKGICSAGTKGCCGDEESSCIYNSGSGCKVNCLGCKLYFCDKALELLPPKAKIYLLKIWNKAKISGFLVLEASADEVFELTNGFPRHKNTSIVTISNPLGDPEFVYRKD